MADMEAKSYVWYMWDCPWCGEVQEADPPDVEPAGEHTECRACGGTANVEGT